MTKTRKRKNPHIGSSLDDFLKQEGTFDELQAQAIKESQRDCVYVIGAGFSAGLGYPLTGDLLFRLWPKLGKARGRAALGK
jgi:hypothetical protein